MTEQAGYHDEDPLLIVGDEFVERCAFGDGAAIGRGKWGRLMCREHLREDIDRYGVGLGR